MTQYDKAGFRRTPEWHEWKAVCKENCHAVKAREAHSFDRAHCTSCGLCTDACPTGAIVSPMTINTAACISCRTIESENEKNIDYTSNPSAYAKYIQDKGYSIYNDENLDYEFYLSPDILRRLKGSRKDYTLYNGTSITDSHGVIRYKSDLFRAGGIASDSKTALKIPEESQIRCNNLSSGGCQIS